MFDVSCSVTSISLPERRRESFPCCVLVTLFAVLEYCTHTKSAFADLKSGAFLSRRAITVFRSPAGKEAAPAVFEPGEGLPAVAGRLLQKKMIPKTMA